MIQIKIKDNEQDYRAVRIEVFMKEQGFQNEFDEIDAVATHLTVYVDGELAGCARCFPHQEEMCIRDRCICEESHGYGVLYMVS